MQVIFFVETPLDVISILLNKGDLRFFLFAFFTDYELLSMDGSLARALYTFQSDNPEELSVPEGSIIKITQYINKHWLEASYQGKTGLFPVTYAERLKNESPLQNDSPIKPCYEDSQKNLLFNWQPGESSEFSRKESYLAQHSHSNGASFVETAFAFSGRNDSELTFPSGALIEVTKDVDEDWLEGSFNGRTGLFPKSYLKSSERPFARAVYPFVGESAGELTFREGDCIFLRKRLNSQWMEGEIDGTVGLFPSSFVIVEVELPTEQNAFANGDFSLVDSPPKYGAHNGSVVPKVKWKRGMKGKALFHFTALYSGDLELNEGDVVTVLEVDDDNWIEGQLASGIRGSCPAAYLEPVFDMSQQYESRSLKSSTQQLALDGNSGIFDDPGYINISQMRSLAQRTSYVVDSYSVKDDTHQSLLDSSLIQDPTPAIIELPSDKATTQKTTPRPTKPLLAQKPGLTTKKQSSSYSVKYLGGEEHSAPNSSQSNVSPSISVQSLLGGSTSSSNTLVSVQSETTSKRFQRHRYFQDGTGTWPGKRTGTHGRVADENKNKRNLIDDDDLLSGNFTSLPTPLVPLPQARLDDGSSESSASEDSPITPRRPAPPPPKRDSSSKNWHVRSQALPGNRSKGLVQGDFSREVSISIAKDHQQLDVKDVKQNGRPHSPHPIDSKRDSYQSIKGSPTMRKAGDHDGSKSNSPSRPRSVHWKDKDSFDAVDKVTSFIVMQKYDRLSKLLNS